MKASARDQMILKQRLSSAVKDPRKALASGWYEDPAFCRGYFDRCEDAALLIAPKTLDLAHKAVEMAVRHGDKHLVHRAWGVLVHAHISRADRFWAGQTLESYRDAALDCCPACCSDFFFRQGDLLGEERKARESLEALERSIAEGGAELSPDALGRRLFVRSISYHHEGHRRRALADAGQALELLSLESPQGFFLDTVALLAIFVGGGDMDDDAVAVRHLERFTERIQGLDGWKPVHTRRLWAGGHLHARLGHRRAANNMLSSAQTRLLDKGLKREALGASLDRAQLKCGTSELRYDKVSPLCSPRGDNVEKAREILQRCLDERPDLELDERGGLEEMRKVLHRWPESAFKEIGNLRRSFVAPVPGQLGERMGPA